MGSATFLIQPLAQGAKLPAFQLGEQGKVTRIAATVLAHRDDVKGETKALICAAVLEGGCRGGGGRGEWEFEKDVFNSCCSYVEQVPVGKGLVVRFEEGEDSIGKVARRLVERVVGEWRGS